MVCYSLKIEVITVDGVSYRCSEAVGVTEFDHLDFPADVMVDVQRNKIVRL